MDLLAVFTPCCHIAGTWPYPWAVKQTKAQRKLWDELLEQPYAHLEFQTLHLQISSGWHYGNWATRVFLLQGERQISPIPIAYFFMLSTKSFIQTTIIPSLTYSTAGLEDHQKIKECLFSSISQLLCLKIYIYIQMSEFSEDNGRNSEHSIWLQFKILQLSYRYFAKVSFKKWKPYSTTMQLFPSHVLQEETVIVL